MIVSYSRYQTLTLDLTSTEGAVTGRLSTAQAMIEEELGRLFDNQARTETITVQRDGRVYPKATPVTVPPSGSESVFHGRALVGVTWDTIPAWESANPPTSTVTYTGGYLRFGDVAATDETRVPVHLERAIADLALALAASPTAVGAATSVKVGDVSVTYAAPLAGDLDLYVPGLRARVRRYRRAIV